MATAIIVLLMVALIGSRPWRTQNRTWFDASALLGALLFGALVIAVA
jgi:hypothetical protein